MYPARRRGQSNGGESSGRLVSLTVNVWILPHGQATDISLLAIMRNEALSINTPLIASNPVSGHLNTRGVIMPC